MSNKRYVVQLSLEERVALGALVKSSQRVSAERRTRAQVLLKIDEGPEGPAWSDARAAEAFDGHPTVVRNLRKRLVLEGFERALERKKQQRPSRVGKLDGAAEARLIATVQGPPPEGRARWTLQLLSGRIVALGISDEPVSRETIRQTLKN